jgi:hypothetical protein
VNLNRLILNAKKLFHIDTQVQTNLHPLKVDIHLIVDS